MRDLNSARFRWLPTGVLMCACTSLTGCWTDKLSQDQVKANVLQSIPNETSTASAFKMLQLENFSPYSNKRETDQDPLIRGRRTMDMFFGATDWLDVDVYADKNGKVTSVDVSSGMNYP